MAPGCHQAITDLGDIAAAVEAGRPIDQEQLHQAWRYCEEKR